MALIRIFAIGIWTTQNRKWMNAEKQPPVLRPIQSVLKSILRKKVPSVAAVTSLPVFVTYAKALPSRMPSAVYWMSNAETTSYGRLLEPKNGKNRPNMTRWFQWITRIKWRKRKLLKVQGLSVCLPACLPLSPPPFLPACVCVWFILCCFHLSFEAESRIWQWA